jgi:hypothetical protein
MQAITIGKQEERAALYRKAWALALITVAYNLIEGLVSVFLGMEDETIALFGFGLDSFVEVISGMGILHMIGRIRRGQIMNGEGAVVPDRFEARALRITGGAFYLLTVGLIATAVLNIYTGREPDTTFWGILVASVSIMTMWLLIHFKVKAGRALGSEAILADANCTKACLWLSVVLLASSLGFELTGMGWLDSAGALGIAVFAFREGREAFEKAEGKACSCAGSCQS